MTDTTIAPATVHPDTNRATATLAGMRKREQAATPGPWGWYGNTDVHDIVLATRNFGRSYIMRFARWGTQKAVPMFSVGREWGRDPDGEVGICPHGRMTKAGELAVYEVAPDATSRRDHRVYRADVVGIRHPDAEFIARAREDVKRLLAAVEAALALHRIEPLYAHADNGECGCPVPGRDADVADDIAYDAAHPEGYGPGGTGLVCKSKVVGHWCPGCADVAVEHGCFETPKEYPPEKCTVRETIAAALLGETTDAH